MTKGFNGAVVCTKYRIDKAVENYEKRYEYRDWETDRKSTRLNSSHRL